LVIIDEVATIPDIAWDTVAGAHIPSGTVSVVNGGPAGPRRWAQVRHKEQERC
jgi:hypothetical protein